MLGWSRANVRCKSFTCGTVRALYRLRLIRTYAEIGMKPR